MSETEKKYIPAWEEQEKAKRMMTEDMETANTEREVSLERTRPILVIYRDNDFFSLFVPEIVSFLRNSGRQVEVQSFPRETTEEEITKWFGDNYKNLLGKRIVSDHTTESAIDSAKNDKDIQDAYNELKGSKTLGETKLEYGYLDGIDSIMASALIESQMDGDSVEPKEFSDYVNRHMENPVSKTLEAAISKAIISIFRAILQKKEYIPGSVEIDANRICDHIPLRRFAYEDEGRFKAIDEIKRWLREAGVSEEALSSNKQAFVHWMIYDRHSGGSGGITEIRDKYDTSRVSRRALMLPLPLSNLLYTVVGRLEIIPEEMISGSLAKVKQKLIQDFHLEPGNAFLLE